MDAGAIGFLRLGASLGPSKIANPIQVVPGYCQEARLPPPPPPRKQVQQQQQPPPPPPREQFNAAFDQVDEYLMPMCSMADSFLLIIAHVLDPTISIKRKEDVLKALASFKKTLAADLDNDRGLFKKFGFSRKRKLTLQGLKDMINNNGNSNGTEILSLAPELASYCSKYIERNICIIKINGTLERTDYECGDVAKPWLLVRELHTGGYMLYTGAEPISKVIEAELTKAGYMDKLTSKKISEKKSWSK